MDNSKRLFVFVAAIAVATTWIGEARAEVDLDRVLDRTVKISKASLRRARRAVALGPFVGAAGSFTLDSSEFDGQVSFGLGVFLFDIPILPDVVAIAKERTKAVLVQRMKDGLISGTLSEEDLASVAKKIYQQTRDEVLGEQVVRAKTVEKPRFALTLDTAKVFAADAWQSRMTLGIGISKVTIGPTIALQYLGDDTIFFLGGEVAIKFLPGKGPRSPVIDAFARMDFGFSENAGNPKADQFVLGLRLLLDVI